MAVQDAGKPLLQDYDSTSSVSSDRDATIDSLRTLEDGEEHFRAEDSRPSRGVLQRLLMAVRRRNVGLGKEDGYDRVRFPLDGKEKSMKREWRVRRCGIRTVLMLPLLVVVFL